MESTIITSTNSQSWEIVPTNAIAGAVLAIAFLYLLFRHFMLVLMVVDIVLGWLRRFSWFPNKGNRRKTFLHWLGAIALFTAFLALAGPLGWLDFIPQ